MIEINISWRFEKKMMKYPTRFGTATKGKNGYLYIYTKKEGNYHKLVHRLVYEEWHKCTLLSNAIVHHKDENPLNNNPNNLELMSKAEHNKLHHTGEKNHNYGKHLSEKIKQKLRESHIGIPTSFEHKYNTSKAHNTTGFFRVSKQKSKTCKRGFIYVYSYTEDGKRKTIKATTIDGLEDKVTSKGLKWLKFEEEV